MLLFDSGTPVLSAANIVVVDFVAISVFSDHVCTCTQVTVFSVIKFNHPAALVSWHDCMPSLSTDTPCKSNVNVCGDNIKCTPTYRWPV